MVKHEEDESGLPRDRLWQPVTAKWFVVVFGFSLVYAVLRYHIGGPVPWDHFPLFILNKIVSMAAVIFVACSYLVGRIFKWHNDDPAIRLVVVKFCGLMGFFLAGVHALFSFALLRPAYFAKFFSPDGRLTVSAEVAVAAGVLALFFLMAPAITTLPMMPKALGGKRWKRAQRAGYISLTLVVIHLVYFGLKGWTNPAGWNAGMPPISLVTVVVAAFAIGVKLWSEKST